MTRFCSFSVRWASEWSDTRSPATAIATIGSWQPSETVSREQLLLPAVTPLRLSSTRGHRRPDCGRSKLDGGKRAKITKISLSPLYLPNPRPKGIPDQDRPHYIMQSVRVYNECKTSKDILFASLIVAVVIPLSTMGAVDAKQSEDKIPDDKLIPRDPAKWVSQYENKQKFDGYENAIKIYVESAQKDNKWNQVMAKEHIRLHNLDTKVGEIGAGLQAVLVDVEHQQNLGIYDPTEAERRYHQWAFELYPNPTMHPEIKNVWLEQIVKSHNSIANHGNVPSELSLRDPEFWIMTANESMCQYVDCTQDIPDSDPITNFVQRYIIPNAHAYKVDTWHIMNGYIYTHSCEGQTGGCMFTLDTKSGVGTLSSSKTTTRSYNSDAIVYASNCSPYYTTAHNTLDGDLTSGVQEWSWNDSSDTSCAVIYETQEIAQNPHASFFATWTIESETTIEN